MDFYWRSHLRHLCSTSTSTGTSNEVATLQVIPPQQISLIIISGEHTGVIKVDGERSKSNRVNNDDGVA